MVANVTHGLIEHFGDDTLGKRRAAAALGVHVHELPDAARRGPVVGIVALAVFDEGEGKCFDVIHRAHVRRNRFQAGQHGRAPALLTGDDLKPGFSLRVRTHQDRLKYSRFGDGVRQLAHLRLGNLAPILQRVRFEFFERDGLNVHRLLFICFCRKPSRVFESGTAGDGGVEGGVLAVDIKNLKANLARYFSLN